jgi:hypothetical protein
MLQLVKNFRKGNLYLKNADNVRKKNSIYLYDLNIKFRIYQLNKLTGYSKNVLRSVVTTKQTVATDSICQLISPYVKL